MVVRILAGVIVAVAVAAVGFSVGLPDTPQTEETAAAGALPVAEHSCCLSMKKPSCESAVQAVEAEAAETCPLKAAANGEAVAAFTGGMSVGVSTVKFNCCAD